MPLLFDVFPSKEISGLVIDPAITGLLDEWRALNSIGKTSAAHILPSVREFPGTVLTFRYVSSNWLCMQVIGLKDWSPDFNMGGRFLTEMQSSELQRFYAVFETVRKTGEAQIVRHCIDNRGQMAFWDTLALPTRYHDLVDELLLILVSIRRNIGDIAVRDLFEVNPVAQLVIIPLRNPDGEVFDAYILEANRRARDIMEIEADSAKGLRMRDHIAAFSDTKLWKSVMDCGKFPSQTVIGIDGTRFSLYVETRESYAVMHLIEMDAMVTSSDLLG